MFSVLIKNPRGRLLASLALAAGLAGCASTGDPGDLALKRKSGPTAQLKLVRPSSPVGILATTYVLVNGKRVASLGSGDTKVIRIPARKNKITVAGWGTFNDYSITHRARAGRKYVAEITNNYDLIVPSVIAPIPTAVIDAAANKGKGGSYKIRIR